MNGSNTQEHKEHKIFCTWSHVESIQVEKRWWGWHENAPWVCIFAVRGWTENRKWQMKKYSNQLAFQFFFSCDITVCTSTTLSQFAKICAKLVWNCSDRTTLRVVYQCNYQQKLDKLKKLELNFLSSSSKSTGAMGKVLNSFFEESKYKTLEIQIFLKGLMTSCFANMNQTYMWVDSLWWNHFIVAW